MQDILQKVDIIVYSDAECERLHSLSGPTNRIAHVCAGVPEGGRGQCNVSNLDFNFYELKFIAIYFRQVLFYTAYKHYHTTI